MMTVDLVKGPRSLPSTSDIESVCRENRLWAVVSGMVTRRVGFSDGRPSAEPLEYR